jgi:RNA polymerase sigma-70 factor (ECF subfamily)
LITEPKSDLDLLERFDTCREESAFTELVNRHGPRVLKVCRRLLANEDDVQDAFQATFFLLARKAGSVAWSESVEGWLCSVARRLALHARAGVSRRRIRERSISTLGGGLFEEAGGSLPERFHPLCDPLDEIQRRDLQHVLRHVLGQLPAKYQAAVVLCYLEGKTNAEAARQLGWPAGSMSRRLQRARSLLRHRLVRAGLMLVFCAACITLSRVRIGPELPRSQEFSVSVQRAMQSFRSTRSGETDLESILQRIVRSGQIPAEREQVEALSRTAEWVAARAAQENPGSKYQAWLDHADRMRLAALGLGQVARTGDRTTLLEAARRLDSACTACHEVFRQ